MPKDHDASTTTSQPNGETAAAAAAGAWAGGDALSKLKERLVKITIPEEGGDETFFRVEGDILLDEDQLEIYANQQEALRRERESQAERSALGAGDIAPQEGRSSLVGVTVGGKLVRWKPGLILSYCVLKNTFGSDQEYQTAKTNMRLATLAWETVCGVKFQHKQELDNSATTRPEGVIFTVRKIDAGGQFIAAAFFPNDPRNRRRVLIDPSYFSPSLTFDKVGVLRHELGHVLGFRHEHIRNNAPAICPDEDRTNTLDLTAYDPQSVMHYFCGGVGRRELGITDVDKIGSQKLYGMPFDSFTEVE